MNKMYLIHYVRRMRSMTKSQMSHAIGCSRYRLMRLETGENEIYLNEWLNFLNWLKKSPVFSEQGFFMGDESKYLPPSAQVLGFIDPPLNSIFLRLLDESYLQALPDLMHEFQIPELYFKNLANPFPGIVALRLLQELVPQGQANNHAELFVQLATEFNFLDPEVLRFGDAKQKGQHFCQQLSLTKMADCHFNFSKDGLADMWLENMSDLLGHVLFKDQVLKYLSVDYLGNIINAVVGERLSLVSSGSDSKHFLHFQGWCRR